MAQLHKLGVLHPDSNRLTWLVLKDHCMDVSTIKHMAEQCSMLRVLTLSRCSVHAGVLDAMTHAFASGKLRLTCFKWVDVDTDVQSVVHAATQWLLAPPRSLVDLHLEWTGSDVRFEAEALVLAVAQRSHERRPCKRVNLMHNNDVVIEGVV